MAAAAKAEREVVLPYCPRPHQLEVHDALQRHRFVVCIEHRRGGKTYQALWWLIGEALGTHRHDFSGGFIAPTYRMAKEIAWRYLKRFLKPVVGCVFNEAELRADLPNGARIRLAGADNPDSLRGVFWDAVVLDEVAQMPVTTWAEVIRPALADRGGRGLFIGTPKGTNLLKEMFDHAERQYREKGGASDWRPFVFRVTDTDALPAEEIQAAREEMSPELFEQEFMCSWTAAVQGAYYAEVMKRIRDEGRVTQLAHDPEYPVYTGWDLGVGDPTAIWFAQVVGNGVQFIDFHESRNMGLPQYVELIRSKPYVYGAHFAPHDIKDRDWSSDGTSRIQMAANMGLEFEPVVRRPGLDREWVNSGIEASRLLLARSAFDADNCADGIKCLEYYHAVQTQRTGEFQGRPEHDWSSHAADALRCLAVGFKQANIGGVQVPAFRPAPNSQWVV